MNKQNVPGFYGQRVFETAEKVRADGSRVVKKIATQTEVDCPCCTYRHILRQDEVGPFVYCTTERNAKDGSAKYAVEECDLAALNPLEKTVVITMIYDRDGDLRQTNVSPANDDWRDGLSRWMEAENIKLKKRKGRY